jgi:rhodanese-related sulfurtransferase
LKAIRKTMPMRVVALLSSMNMNWLALGQFHATWPSANVPVYSYQASAFGQTTPSTATFAFDHAPPPATPVFGGYFSDPSTQGIWDFYNQASKVPDSFFGASIGQPDLGQPAFSSLQAAHNDGDCAPLTLQNTVPPAPGVEYIEPHAAQQCLQTGSCVVIDCRDNDRDSGYIPQAQHIPSMSFMPQAGALAARTAGVPMVVFHCQYSAHRAPSLANFYKKNHAPPNQRVAIMRGGFRAWRCAGLSKTSGGMSHAHADAYAATFR